ncbi:unnamed protein product [Allacma fusca]|uniref:RRM domain-containing protein n=1 Tax=Allacma fusca TaxID=39272 RepID=A0A8J2K0S0_9HEXA|nr:unnamed protein product [Allacma fusca]
MADQQVDRPLRSVFVGNIPYEVTEEKLKEIFSEVGPVQSLKLVYDRETGKPKGYGFCEYKDVETALSAMRNLNGYEINGRILRVDNAGAERHRMAEIGNNVGQNGPRHDENPFNMGSFRDEGPPAPEKAPEIIAKTVASLPPEQMFDLMKQMKLCIQNNPNEARTMLLQNPQLAYALLQAQVVMKIIDPSTALTMLHKDSSVPVGTLLPEGQMGVMAGTGPGPVPAMTGPPPPTENPWITAAASSVPLMPLNPPGPFGQGPVAPVPVQPADLDLRQLDPRMRGQAPTQDFDLRDPRAQERFSMDPRRDRDRDLRDRDMRDRDMNMMRDRDRDLRDSRAGDPREMRDRDLRDPRMFGNQASSSGSMSNPTSSDPRSRRAEPSVQSQQSSASTQRVSSTPSLPAGMAGFAAGATDTEKAALIMQVLKLSDEQIAVLPAEQRQSILVLKEQIAKSTSQNR